MIDDELVRLRRSGISGQMLHVASTCPTPMQFLKRPSTSQTEVGAGQGPHIEQGPEKMPDAPVD